MKLADLEPVWLGFYKRPHIGIAFNCPGECCAERRALEAAAAKAEKDAGAAWAAWTDRREQDPLTWPVVLAACDLRQRSKESAPFRIWIAFSNSLGHQAQVGDSCPFGSGRIDQLYTRQGDSFATLTVKEQIERPGHWTGRITRGEVK